MKFVQLSSGPHWADPVPRRDGPACLKRVGDAHRHVSASSIGCVAGFRACQCVIADRSSVHSVRACVKCAADLRVNLRSASAQRGRAALERCATGLCASAVGSATVHQVRPDTPPRGSARNTDSRLLSPVLLPGRCGPPAPWQGGRLLRQRMRLPKQPGARGGVRPNWVPGPRTLAVLPAQRPPWARLPRLAGSPVPP
jgi:hypothetical protein